MNVPPAQQRRLESLAHANTVRHARAQLKRDLAGGSVELAEILEDSPAWTQSMKVRVLLLALPGIGPTKADRALTSCQIPHSKTVAGLSGRQEAALVKLFRADASPTRCTGVAIDRALPLTDGEGPTA